MNKKYLDFRNKKPDKNMKNSTTIVTSMHNRSNGVLEIIDNLFFPSILRNASSNLELIIIDDCSPLKKETNALVRKYLPELNKLFGSVVFTRNTENFGFAKSFNHGIEMANGNNLLVTNDDVYFPKGSINKLVKTLYEPEEFLLVGPISNNRELWSFQYCKQAPKLSSYSQEEILKLETFALWLEDNMAGNRRPVDNLCGFCFTTNTLFMRELGSFNEKYGYGYFEDTDLIQRINSWYGPDNTAVNLEVFVGHGGINGSSQTFKQQKVKAITNLLINNFKYANTWGYGTLLRRIIYGLKSQTGKGTISDLLPETIKF
jgi:glycosyltransferase involved in cell wall biosynthesis